MSTVKRHINGTPCYCTECDEEQLVPLEEWQHCWCCDAEDVCDCECDYCDCLYAY